MSNNIAKSNGVLITVLLFMMVFGVKVNVGQSSTAINNPDCIRIEASVIDPPPVLPIIQKEHLDNKTYVIKVLINHINALNTYIAASNKHANDVVTKYNDCVSS